MNHKSASPPTMPPTPVTPPTPATPKKTPNPTVEGGSLVENLKHGNDGGGEKALQEAPPPQSGLVRRQPLQNEAQRIQEETKRLQKEVEALKTLKTLQQEEEELRKWLKQKQKTKKKKQGLYTESPPSSGSSFGIRQIRKKSAQHKESFFGGFAKQFNITRRRIPRSRSSDSDDDDVDSDVDVESQSKRKSSPSPRRRASSKSRAKRVGGIKGRGSTRDLLRKIAMAIITDIDDETLQREDTETVLIIITLIKEAMLGMIIALAAVSLILFIDHAFVLRLPIASNFRRATFHMMNNQDTLRDLENNAGLKFIEMGEYTSMLNETEQAFNKTKLGKNILRTRSVDLLSTQNDLAAASQSYPELIVSLGLDKFCPECLWSKNMRVTCEGRVKQLISNKNTGKFQAMLSTMQRFSCNTGAEKIKKDFCLECIWDGSTTCIQRVTFLNEKLRIPLQKATSMAMQKESCKNTEVQHFEEHKNQKDVDLTLILDKFCQSCTWSKSKRITCRQRVDTVQAEYEVPVSEAILSAMKKKSCKVTKDNHFIEGEAGYRGHDVDFILELDKFCQQCISDKRRRMTCKDSAEAIQDAYEIPKYQAMQLAMKRNPICKTQDSHQDSHFLGHSKVNKEKKMPSATPDELLSDWEETKKDFCADCEWDASMSCIQRVNYLHEKYGTPTQSGTAITMSETPKCRESYYAEDLKKIEKFCEDCEWGWNGKTKMTCGQRVDYLKYTYKNPDRVAKLAAMERLACSI